MVNGLLTDQQYFGLPSQKDLHFIFSPDTSTLIPEDKIKQLGTPKYLPVQ